MLYIQDRTHVRVHKHTNVHTYQRPTCLQSHTSIHIHTPTHSRSPCLSVYLSVSILFLSLSLSLSLSRSRSLTYTPSSTRACSATFNRSVASSSPPPFRVACARFNSPPEYNQFQLHSSYTIMMATHSRVNAHKHTHSQLRSIQVAI